jgi:hypothetical protein
VWERETAALALTAGLAVRELGRAVVVRVGLGARVEQAALLRVGWEGRGVCARESERATARESEREEERARERESARESESERARGRARERERARESKRESESETARERARESSGAPGQLQGSF